MDFAETDLDGKDVSVTQQKTDDVHRQTDRQSAASCHRGLTLTSASTLPPRDDSLSACAEIILVEPITLPAAFKWITAFTVKSSLKPAGQFDYRKVLDRHFTAASRCSNGAFGLKSA